MFALDERLAADTVELARWPLCRVLLMNDSTYPWLILVPQRPGLREFRDLSADDRAMLMGEIVRAQDIVEETFRPDKINTAALGNVVAQLHIHVIARFRSDPAWPRPVWGVVPAAPYSEGTLAQLKDRLGRRLTS